MSEHGQRSVVGPVYVYVQVAAEQEGVLALVPVDAQAVEAVLPSPYVEDGETHEGCCIQMRDGGIVLGLAPARVIKHFIAQAIAAGRAG